MAIHNNVTECKEMAQLGRWAVKKERMMRLHGHHLTAEERKWLR